MGMNNLTKTEAIKMLGGSKSSAAKAIGCTVQAVHKWPEMLSDRIADRVIAAQMRQQKRKPARRKPVEQTA